jgi:RHS repeat-associated protein
VQEQNLGRGLFSHSHSRSGSVIQSRTRGTLANSHQIEYRDPHFGVVGGANEMSTWIYGSDPRGQITSARKRLDAAAGAPFAPGWDASYTYDDLGNRVTWGQGTGGENFEGLEPTSYSRNALHQYTAITGVNAVHVTGQAPAAQEVKINGDTAQRAGHFYHRRVQDGARSDLTLPHWLEVTVTATTTLPNAQTVTAQRAGSLWQPPIPEEPVYDLDGNLIEDGRWLYTWDGENRLTQMLTRPAAVAAGAPNWRLSFAYDHQSRRIQKKVEVLNGSVWEVRSDARFIYDGWNVVAEVELHGAAWDAPGGTSAMDPRPAYVRRSWVWGEDLSGTLDGAGGVGGLLVVTRHARGGQGRESYWAMSDLNGNVTGLVSTTSGRMPVYEYDAFGRLLRENEPEPGLNPVRFGSKYQDVETGLVYYGYRYYSPELGRWLSTDPLIELGFQVSIRGVLNGATGDDRMPYVFVNNDPINYYDFLGLEWHHLLPRAIFTNAFLEAHGITDLDINDTKYGWELDFRTHRGRGDSLHSAGWNPDWKNWIKSEIAAGRKIDKCSIEKQLDVMKGKYASFLSQGKAVTGRYKAVRYSNLKAGVGGGAGLIFASLLAGELTGANAVKAEEIQRSFEKYNSLDDDDYSKMVEAAIIANGLSEITGANPTMILGAFFK